jgi:TonB family protein
MYRRGIGACWLVASLLVLAATPAAAPYAPARLKSGDAPAPPPNSIGWAWDVVDVTVDRTGRVTAKAGLGGTRGWMGAGSTVGNWTFEPARDGDTAIDSHVLVAACYRAPTLVTGPESAPPRVHATPDVPSPTTLVPAPYPPNALGDAVVIVELTIDESGAVKDARIVQSGGGFDSPALDTARQWRFRPAQRAGAPVPASAYIVFGFRQPIT